MAFFQSATLWVSQLPDNVAGLVLDVPGRGIRMNAKGERKGDACAL